MRHLGLNAIVLQKQNFGEYDQFVTLFSASLGKIQAVAKGARKINSAFTGHLEILNICTFEIYRSAKNFTIVQCQSQKTFKPLRNDLDRALLAILMMEIFQKCTREQEHGHSLFELLETTLEHLSRSKKNSIIIEAFKIKLLQLLGVLPNVSRCSHCSRKWENSSTIGLDDEGHLRHLHCNDCQKKPAPHTTIPFNIMKLVNFLTRADFTEVEKIKLKPDEAKLLQKITGSFLQNYINREISSEKVLAQLVT